MHLQCIINYAVFHEIRSVPIWDRDKGKDNIQFLICEISLIDFQDISVGVSNK